MKDYILIHFPTLTKLEGVVGRGFSLTEAVIISFISSWGDKGFYGSQKTMAKKLHITDRTLRNHLRKLIKEEIIFEKKNKGYDTKCLIFNKNLLNQTIYNSPEEDEEFQELLNSFK